MARVAGLMMRCTTCAVVSARNGSVTGAGQPRSDASCTSSSTGGNSRDLCSSMNACSAAKLSPTQGTHGGGGAASAVPPGIEPSCSGGRAAATVGC